VDIEIEADGEVRAVARKGLEQPLRFLRGVNGNGHLVPPLLAPHPREESFGAYEPPNAHLHLA